MLNSKKNTLDIFAQNANRRCIHIFISSKIALSKKFKSSILDQSFFTNCFCLLIIDKINLIKKLDKTFNLCMLKLKDFKIELFVVFFCCES